MKRLLIIFAMLLVPAAAALAAQHFAFPQFTSGYQMPSTETPPPRAGFYDYLDVAALLVALAAASYLALRSRSRRGLWVLALLSLLYFGFWRAGCICSIGAIQNVTLSLFDTGYVVPAAVVVFLLAPLAAALLFGRTFCASVCPLGAIQDLTLIRPVKVPAPLQHGLGLLAYVYLGAAVLFAATGSAFIICDYDPFVSFFRLMPFFRPVDTMDALAGSTDMLLWGAALLAVGLFIGRPYCRFMCPLGAIFRIISQVSRWRAEIAPDRCVRCRNCADACPYGAILAPTPTQAEGAPPVRKGRLAALAVAAAALVGLLGWFGSTLAVPFARMDYLVQQAERVRLEELGQVTGTVDLSDAFYGTHRPREDLYAEARAVQSRFVLGGGLLGAWVGLVIGVKLIHLSVRRTRTGHETDPAGCVACGRCFEACPVHRQRLQETPSKAAPS